MIERRERGNEISSLDDLPRKLRKRIIEEGEVSQDGVILRFKELNRKVDLRLVRGIADYMVDWIRQLPAASNLTSENATVVVVESSGNILAGFVGESLGLPVVIVKKGQPATMFGEILSKEIHSFTRKKPTIISVEKKDIQGRKLILVDDFAATGETLGVVEKMAQEAEAQILSICVAISKPSQGSGEILSRIPSLSIATIEEMIPAKDTEPAKIKFAGVDEMMFLQREWGEG